MKLNILYLILAVVFLASCSSDDGITPDPGEQPGRQIRFEMGFAGEDRPQSRAATDADFKTIWKTGDEIGIFAVKHGESLAASNNSIHNMKITYNGTSWNGAYWPNDENKNQNLDFYAYYPYDASATDPTAYTFSVMTDQHEETDYNQSDLLLAKTEDVAKIDAAVSLQFSHALSLVQVEVKREVNMPHFDESDFTVTLTGALPSVNLGWGNALTGTGGAANIVMHKVDDMDYTYRALVPAQTLAADAKVTFVQNTTNREINMEYQSIATAALTAAKAHKYSVTLGWGIDPEHEYAVGDVYPHVGPAMGIVYWLDDPSNGKSKNGKAVGLQETTGRWGAYGRDEDADGVIGIRSSDDGKTATRNLIAERKDEQNFSANYFIFNWIYQIMNEGNLDGVWYLPAREELSALQSVKADVNTGLSAISGAAQLSNNWYWSSSEYGIDAAWVVGFNFGNTYGDLKGVDANRARCVLAF